MPVLIDERLCDTNPACGAARACTRGAITFDRARNRVQVNNSLCTDCGICTRYCPPQAVVFARTAAELERKAAAIRSSTAGKDDLLEQKYGVRPGDPAALGPNLEAATCDNWETAVLGADLPVVVDLWAQWCAPCRILAPTFKDLAKEYEGRMRFFKLDTEECQRVPGRYGVTGIPTLLFFHRGQLLGNLVGAVPKEQLRQAIGQVLDHAAS